MTAFASGERTTPWGTLTCELRSVNHRFLEIGTRLPDELRALEPALRERIGARISRGKVDIGMRLRAPEGGDALRVDPAVVEQLSGIARDLLSRFPTMQVNFTDLLQFPGMLGSRATPASCSTIAGSTCSVSPPSGARRRMPMSTLPREMRAPMRSRSAGSSARNSSGRRVPISRNRWFTERSSQVSVPQGVVRSPEAKAVMLRITAVPGATGGRMVI